jgi:type IV pilus assembly protein PilF
MRRPDAVVVLLLVALAGAGCSRVAFFKTDPSRQGYERVSEPVVVNESAAGRQRDGTALSLARAQQFLAAGDLAAAETQAKQALRGDPKSADAYTLLGAIASRRGREADAGAHYKQAATLAPNAGAALNNYGAWLCSNGHAAEALGWFERALQDPAYRSPASAMANAGKCALDAGRVEDAERSLRAALDLDAENGVALEALARMRYSQARYMDARAFSERRLAAAPASADALLLASQIEDKLGDSAASARYGRRLREEFPGASSGNAGGSNAP